MIMRSKKNVLIGVILIIVLAVIIILVININKDRKNIELNESSIKKSYGLLSDKVSEYNQIREDFNELSTGLLLDNYKEKHEEFITLLTKYNEVISNIDDYAVNIKAKCSNVSSVSEVSSICNGYEQIYEKLVNLYVNDIKKYNTIVTKYNEYKKEEIPMFEMIHEEYIDYNNDNVYEGRDSSEED